MFYVTAKEHNRTFFLAGPYESEEEASNNVGSAKFMALDHKLNSKAGRAAFMSYGVTKVNSVLQVKTALGIL